MVRQTSSLTVRRCGLRPGKSSEKPVAGGVGWKDGQIKATSPQKHTSHILQKLEMPLIPPNSPSVAKFEMAPIPMIPCGW